MTTPSADAVRSLRATVVESGQGSGQATALLASAGSFSDYPSRGRYTPFPPVACDGRLLLRSPEYVSPAEDVDVRATG